jgi:hypothetical protein
MDEALRRFERAGTETGIITSLDADTLVDADYLTALESFFLERPLLDGATVYFEHPLEGPFPARVYNGIMQYELHLRYFVNALRHLGYPYAYHTVGSAFAVRAAAYAREGGMNRRQGGEDFYFLQKIIRGERFTDLTTTRVIPSPRPATRVPFGTGPEVTRFLEGDKEVFLTYNLQAFLDLGIFFRKVPRLFSREMSASKFYGTLPYSLQGYLDKEVFLERMDEILGNVASPESFLKRFFRWFNTFMVIRYLDSVHPDLFPRKPVAEEARRLLQLSGAGVLPGDLRGLLMYYRKTDRRASGWNKAISLP